MPKSRVRKKPVYTPPPTKSTAKRKVSPVWLVPTMVACLVLGLIWISVYYITNGGPNWMASMQGWNLLGGFGLIVIGVILSTQWR